MNDILLVISTFPDMETARQTGTSLVESQLAACVNLHPGWQSIYRWKGTVEEAGEVLALFKTTPVCYEAFEARLKELHPYEVPEILALPVEKAAAAYVSWVTNETQRQKPEAQE